jgi:hypothetical protein
MLPTPLNLKLHVVNSSDYLSSIRWLNEGHFRYVVGKGALYGHFRATLNGRLYFRLIPGVINVERRRKILPILLGLASHKAKSTRRPKVAGGGVHHQTRAGTPSVYAYPRLYKCLRFAREGFLGFEGLGRGSGGRGCGPTAWTRDHPEEYAQLVPEFEYFGDLFRAAEPEIAGKQVAQVAQRPELIIGKSLWSQAVGNLNFPMTQHIDGNIGYSAQVVFGDYAGGFLIFPEVACAAALGPADLLIFDGCRPHGVSPFVGFRLSLVCYLKANIFRCLGKERP